VVHKCAAFADRRQAAEPRQRSSIRTVLMIAQARLLPVDERPGKTAGVQPDVFRAMNASGWWGPSP